MIFGFICTIILSFFYLFAIQEFGPMYFDTYIIVWFGMAICGWMLGGSPRFKQGFLTISLLSIFAFSFWFTKNPTFRSSWGYKDNDSIVRYHEKYHIKRKQTSTSSSSSPSSSSGSYSSGSSYGGRSYSGGGFSGGK